MTVTPDEVTPDEVAPAGATRRVAATLGAERLRELEADLRAMAPAGGFRLDVPGWFGP